jgi:Na+-driven multidrug efflux pump
MPIPRLFFTAALPGALGMLASSIYGTMDGILVGNFVGETPFAAINLAMPFVIVLFAFGDLIGVGSAVPISIALGENRDDDANNIFTCSCLANVALGALLGLLLWFAAPTLFALLGATGELASLATAYLRVYAVFAPLTTIGYALDNYLRISGHITRSLVANTFMAVFGAVLEFILLGPCDMGVRAAAVSYSLAMVSANVIALWPFVRGGLQLRFVRPRFRLREIFEVFRCGFSTFLENFAGRVTSIAMNAALLALGGADAVSIFGASLFLQGFIEAIIYGTMDALQPAVGYNWGARDYGRVKALELWCFGASAVVSLLFMAGLLIAPDLFLRLFLPQGEHALMAEGSYALRIIASSFAFRWFVFGAQSFLVNVGEARSSVLLSICTALAVPLPLIWLLSPLGLLGLWLNPPATSALCALLGAVLLFRLRAKVRLLRMSQ